MKFTKEMLLNGWLPVILAFAIFAVVYLTDMITGVVENCIFNGKKFEIKRLLQSFIKIVMAGIVTVIIIVCINCFWEIIGVYDFVIPDIATEAASLVVFALLYLNGFLKKVKQLYNKIQVWLDLVEVEKGVIARTEAETPPVEYGEVIYVTDGKG
jgi:hypothetical protein